MKKIFFLFLLVFLISFNLVLGNARSENYEIGLITISSQSDSFVSPSYSGDVKINTFQPVINVFESSSYAGTVFLYNSYTTPPPSPSPSSSSGGGSGSDYMTLDYDIDCLTNTITLIATDRNGNRLRYTEITLTDNDGNILLKGKTDINGILKIDINEKTINYNILSKKVGYYNYKTNIQAACYDLIEIIKTYKLIPLSEIITLQELEQPTIYIDIRVIPEEYNLFIEVFYYTLKILSFGLL